MGLGQIQIQIHLTTRLSHWLVGEVSHKRSIKVLPSSLQSSENIFHLSTAVQSTLFVHNMQIVFTHGNNEKHIVFSSSFQLLMIKTSSFL